MQASGFTPSDFVLAGQVPGSIFWFRKWGGLAWWTKPYVPLGPMQQPE